MTEKEILEKRNQVFQAQRALGQRISDESRGFTDEERTEFEKSETDYKALTEQLTTHRLLNQREAELAETEYRAKQSGGGRAPSDTGQMNEGGTPEYRNVFGKMLREGSRDLSRDEHDVARNYRAMSKATGAGGGFLAPEKWANDAIVKMAQYGGMMQAANVVRTSTGNQVYFPVVNDLSNIGEILGENTAASTQDLPLEQVPIDAYKYSSKIVLVSMELAQDEDYGLEGILSDAFARRIGVIANTHFTNGDGTDKPTGIVTSIAAGRTFTGAATDGITRADILRTKDKVDPAYRIPTAAFMMNSSTETEIKLLTVGSGDARPLWNGSMVVGAPDTIDGSPYFINQQLANLGAGNTPLLFGDFSKYLIRIAKGLEVFRFGEKYMNQGSYGYLAFMRADGRLLDTNAVGKFVNAAA